MTTGVSTCFPGWLPIAAALSIRLTKAVFVVVTPVGALAMTPWLIDDSFIFIRIARNLVLGSYYEVPA